MIRRTPLAVCARFTNSGRGRYRPGYPEGRRCRAAHQSLAGHAAALVSSGEAKSCASCTPATQSQPSLADGPTRASLRTWASRKACTYARSRSIRSCTDGPVAGDDDIDVARHALEQPQRGEVVLDRVGGAVQVEHRDQDIGKHVRGDEDPSFLDQKRRMARGMRLMLDNADLVAIPRNLRRPAGQAGNEAEQVQRHLLGDAGSLCYLRNPARQLISGSDGAACRAVP